MPSSASATATLADTSVAVPLLLADHEHHADVDEALRGRAIGLAGHAAFEANATLLTRDARALNVYSLMGVDVELIA